MIPDPPPAQHQAGARVRAIVRRRKRSLTAVALVAAVVALAAGGVWNWLLPPTGGLRASAAFTAGLWLLLAASGATVVALVDQRPARRVTVAAALGVALVVLCGAPAGWFWTFAVSHRPDGAGSPQAAVWAYFSSGPIGGRFGGGDDELRAMLCPQHRRQLLSQAAQITSDIQRSAAGGVVTFMRAEPGGGAPTVTGDRATVATPVTLTYTYNQRQPMGTTVDDVPAGRWTFHLVLQ